MGSTKSLYFIFFRFLLVVILLFTFYFLDSRFVFATEYTSTSFKVIDPVINIGVGRSMSDSFQVEQSIGQPAIGISTSDSFQVKGGFLYFSEPEAAPAPTPTPTPAADGGKPLSSLAGTFAALKPFLPSVPAEIPEKCPVGFSPGDLNCDGKTDLQDLSIFLFLNSAAFPNPADINKDYKINSSDLSILLSSWTERLLAFAPGRPFGAFERRREAEGERRQFATIGETVSPKDGVATTGESLLVRTNIFEGIERFFSKVVNTLRSAIRFFIR